jgi:probable HAF family extracellular repeat protein
VNDAGQVVGTSETASGETHAFLWTEADGMLDLGNWSATAVSDREQVIGSIGVGSFFSERAVSWTRAGGLVDLHSSGSQSWAAAVNDSGQVAVNWIAPRGFGGAFLWTRDGGAKHLGTLGGRSTGAVDVNEGGQVVGAGGTSLSDMDGTTHAFAWTSSLGLVDVPGRDGSDSGAADVNNAGQIAGRSYTPWPDTRATLWTVPAPPSPPRGVTATSGDGQANVAFVPPTFPGGAPIIHYDATASPGGPSASGTSSPITVDGLENGTAHTFTVTAVNAFGASPPSVPSNAVVPEGPEREHPDPPAESPRAAVPGFAATDTPRRRPPDR